MITTLALALALGLATPPPPAEVVPVPDGTGGIGFDDLLFAPELARFLVPSGRTGRLNLLDPKTRAFLSIEGFSSGPASGEGHGKGTTSADQGPGLLFATDRDRAEVAVVAVGSRRIVSRVKLAARPDYVRWVEPTSEVWVTEPGRKQVEFFRLDRQASQLAPIGALEIADGPESLVVDVKRGRAFTHTWHDTTLAIDLRSHRILSRWKNACSGARGIALDARRGFLFVGCEEGKPTALDVDHEGKVLGQVDTGKGVDIIAYAPRLAHLYVPGGDDATLTVIGVASTGQLSVLGSLPTAHDAHCVAVDDDGNVVVCDPGRGALLSIRDTYPAWK